MFLGVAANCASLNFADTFTFPTDSTSIKIGTPIEAGHLKINSWCNPKDNRLFKGMNLYEKADQECALYW